MTKMKEFYEKVANDKELQTKFFEIIRDAEMAVEQAIEEKLTGFAKEAGYDITLDEMKDFFRKMNESEESVLRDEELDMVAGGKSGAGGIMIATSFLFLGLVCAVTSIKAEIDGIRCEKVFE